LGGKYRDNVSQYCRLECALKFSVIQARFAGLGIQIQADCGTSNGFTELIRPWFIKSATEPIFMPDNNPAYSFQNAGQSGAF
jgi:hypothetical protein